MATTHHHRKAAAVSTGVLFFALGGLASSPAEAEVADCINAGGVLAGVSATLCAVTNGLTDDLDDVTARVTEPVAGGLSSAAEGLHNGVGQVRLPEPRSPAPGASGRREPEERVPAEPAPQPDSPQRVEGIVVQSRKPELLGLRERTRPMQESSTVSLSEVPFIWPSLDVPELSQNPAVTTRRGPHRPYDPAETALTAALLLSAVLAARVVSVRRARRTQAEGIPFEPVGLTRGRHRLA